MINPSNAPNKGRTGKAMFRSADFSQPKKRLQSENHTDLFSCRFREGISFLYRTEHFSDKGAEKRRGRGVANKKGKKEKRTRENRSAYDTSKI